ncbi:MAG: SoxR reducing system RseC family protein [Bacteroidota bacterium]
MKDEVLVEEGIVFASANGIAEVSIQQNDNCEECSAKIICKPQKDNLNIVRVIDPFGVAIGDKVRIEIHGKSLLKASFNLYGLPLILLLVGIFSGSFIFSDINYKELFSFLFGLLLIAIYFVMTISANKNLHNHNLPKIVFVKRNK